MSKSNLLNKHSLIRMFKEFKRNPLKVFVVGDFKTVSSDGHFIRGNYLKTLIIFDLIEQVPVIYKYGNKYVARKDVYGYRLK